MGAKDAISRRTCRPRHHSSERGGANLPTLHLRQMGLEGSPVKFHIPEPDLCYDPLSGTSHRHSIRGSHEHQETLLLLLRSRKTYRPWSQP